MAPVAADLPRRGPRLAAAAAAQSIGGVSLESQRTYYFLCLGAPRRWRSSCVARVRRSGLGRSLLAVRDNELAAAAMGLSPTRVKLFAFAALRSAGRPGRRRCSSGSSCSSRPTASWPPTRSCVVAIAVVGGLASITGADPRQPLRRRAPGLLPRQPRGRPAHQRRRGAGPAPVLPRRVRPDPVQRPRPRVLGWRGRAGRPERRREPPTVASPSTAGRPSRPRARPPPPTAPTALGRRRGLRSASAPGSSSTTSTSTWTGARSSASSAPTAPASRR